MTFLYKSEPVRGAIWQRMFTEQLPDLPFCVWPDTGDKDAVATSAPGRSPTTIVEAGDAESVMQNPQHPYTRLLVDSIPSPDLDAPWGNGRPLSDGFARPAPVAAGGRPFVARCPHAMPCCPHIFRRSTRPTHPRRCAACCTRTRRASRKRD